MMNTLAGMGLAGGAVLALWLLVSGALKNRLPARWHYRVLKASLFFFLVPVGRLLPLAGRALSAMRTAPAVTGPVPAPAAPNIPVTVLPRVPVTAPAAPVVPGVPQPEPFSVTAETLRALALVWAVGAAGMLAYKAFVYLRLRRRVFRENRPVSSREAQLVFWACKRQMGLRGSVDLRENPAARSPFAAGLLRPTVVIPSVSLGREELRYLFLHELTHIKSGDLWVRFLAMLAQVIHWYNPFAYLLCRSIQTVSEQSCDERVACPLPPEERYVYGNVILKLAAGAAAGSGDWAASLSARESMERRLTRVLKTEKLRGYKRLLALALALAILACGGGAALAARNPLPVSKEAEEPARTVTALPTDGGDKSGGTAAKPGGAAPAVPAPAEEQVLAARKEALQGMSDQQIQKLTETVKTANLCLEQEYMYNDLFGRLEDPESLYWNYFHQTGEIQIDWATEGHIDKEAVCAAEGLTEEEFYAKYGAQVVAANRYDAAFFISLFNTLRDSAQNSALKAELQYLIDQTALARDTHEMERVNNVYKKLHDLDYFLLRYGPADAGPYMQDTSTISKYYGTLGAFYSAPAPAENPAAGETAGGGGEPDRPVTTNGTPSEAFLKELRAHLIEHGYPVTEDTPVVFGDHELILKRGGTLLPDEDFESYSYEYPFGEGRGFGRISKRFVSKRPSDLGDYHLFEEYAVGNEELLRQHHYAAFVDKQLAAMADGDYPKNSRGETYGHEVIAEYVGYYPDLCETIGDHNQEGYVTYEDFHVKAVSRHLLEAECPHQFSIPLYDKEHNQIGTRTDPCSGHYAEAGMSIDEVKAALAAGETVASAASTYSDPSQETLAKIREAWEVAADTPVLFGDRELILSRGGTLLPDDDPSSYCMAGDTLYKQFKGKDGRGYEEYEVGNVEALSEVARKLADQQLVNGDYPRNSKGETYGSDSLLSGFVGCAPDLIAAVGEDNVEGYIRERDEPGYELQKARDIEGYMALRKANPGPQPIPLYNSEGTVIGTFMCGGGYGPEDLGIEGMSIEEAKAAVAAMFDAE